MEQRLLVMSVTALGDGVCVAGVDRTGRWVRPTRQQRRDWRQLHVADLKNAGGQVVVQVGHEVGWVLGPPAPCDLHTEDVFVGRERPRLLRPWGHIELLARCECLRESDLAAFLSGHDRSLMLCRPEKVIDISFSTAGKGGVSSRLRFGQGTLAENFSVTDLRWRALGRRLLARQGKPNLSWSAFELRRHTGLRIQYLAIGRGQPWNEQLHALAGAHWPFVVNVFTDPPLDQEIDYGNL